MKESIQLTPFHNDICLFCGCEMKAKWDDQTRYFECDCSDAELKRTIENQIVELKKQIPKPKYRIEMREHLVIDREESCL